MIFPNFNTFIRPPRETQCDDVKQYREQLALTLQVWADTIIVGGWRMETPSRRAFLATSAGCFCAIHRASVALADLQVNAIDTPVSLRISLANALNFRSFEQNRAALGLTAVMAMRSVDGKLGSYPTGSLFLFPFNRDATSARELAHLPGSNTASPLIKAAPMTTLGLPPDEFFCHYVLKAPWQSFISCILDMPIAREIGAWPWHSNVEIGGTTIGIRWTSSNLNHPWFAGSRWIPESDDGQVWRARIIDGVHRAAVMTS